MTYIPGDLVSFSFETRNYGYPQAADSTPQCFVYVDGVDLTSDWTDLIITEDSSGNFGGPSFVYIGTATVPVSYIGKHTVEFRVLATVSGDSDTTVAKSIQVGKADATTATGDDADAASGLTYDKAMMKWLMGAFAPTFFGNATLGGAQVANQQWVFDSIWAGYPAFRGTINFTLWFDPSSGDNGAWIVSGTIGTKGTSYWEYDTTDTEWPVGNPKGWTGHGTHGGAISDFEWYRLPASDPTGQVLSLEGNVQAHAAAAITAASLATSSQVANIQNNTFVSTNIPQQLQTTPTTAAAFTVRVIFNDETGSPKNLDSGNPAVTLINQAATDLSARLTGGWSNPATGEYVIQYQGSTADALDLLDWNMTGTINSKVRRWVGLTQLSNTVAADFTATDRNTLNAVATAGALSTAQTTLNSINVKTSALPATPASQGDVTGAVSSLETYMSATGVNVSHIAGTPQTSGVDMRLSYLFPPCVVQGSMSPDYSGVYSPVATDSNGRLQLVFGNFGIWYWGYRWFLGPVAAMGGNLINGYASASSTALTPYGLDFGGIGTGFNGGGTFSKQIAPATDVNGNDIPSQVWKQTAASLLALAAGTIGNALAAFIGGITSLAAWLRAIMRSDTADPTGGEIGGTFSAATMSEQAIAAKTALLGSSAVVTNQPNTETLDKEITQYDDYLRAMGNALSWTNADGTWAGGDLTGATITFTADTDSGTQVTQLTGYATVPTGTQLIEVDMASANSGSFSVPGKLYHYQVLIVKSAHRTTSICGAITVSPSLNPPA